MTAVNPSVFKLGRVGAMEEAVAEYAKPMVASIAGAAAPPGKKGSLRLPAPAANPPGSRQ
jgi:hypothetical protein